MHHLFYKVTPSLLIDIFISGNKSVIVIKQLEEAKYPGATQDTFIELLNEVK